MIAQKYPPSDRKSREKSPRVGKIKQHEGPVIDRTP